ncbi:MAG: Spy/CpxP family protein refolding chaperone [Elusimicrobiota bacterium]
MKNKAQAVRWALMGALMLSALSVAAERGAQHKEGIGEKHLEKIESKLGLSDDQKKKLREHRKTHREEAKKLRKEIKEKREAFQVELEKPELSADATKKAHAELQQVRNKMADHHLEGILAVRQILTPEQFKKFKEMMRQRREGKRWGKKDESESKPDRRRRHWPGQDKHEGERGPEEPCGE